MDLNNKSQSHLPPIYSENQGYQHVPIYDIGFQQPTAPSEPDHNVVITQQPQQVIIQSKYYFNKKNEILIYRKVYPMMTRRGNSHIIPLCMAFFKRG